MDWTPQHAATLKAFAAKFPLPQGDPGDEHEDRCREWTLRLGQQFRFTFGDGWGRKKASPNRPWSKDNLPYKGTSEFVGFDVMAGAGTGKPKLNADKPLKTNLSGQYFETVDPIDHLADAPDPDPPDPPTPPTDIEALAARVAKIERWLMSFEA